MEQELSLLIVFAAGILSFLSPCVLSLIPGYIAFVSGLSVDDMISEHEQQGAFCC
jgi:cytochrome c-type biogenesis protein